MFIFTQKMKKNLVYSITDIIFSNSKIFDLIRKIIHRDYKDEKEVISKIFHKNKKTLDFGCGAGQFSVIFNPKKYYGVDTDKKYIKFCKKNHKGNFYIINNSPPYQFNDKYFDQILVSAVIHHIDKRLLTKILKEFKRILKDNGKLIIIDHYSKEHQKNIFCKFLIIFDRGKYFRNPNNVIKIFSKNFKVKKMINFINKPYKDYMLILNKN